MGKYAVKENGKLIFGEKNKSSDNDLSDSKISESLEQDTAIATVEKPRKGLPLRISSNPLKLVSVKTIKNKQLKCCAMSPDGQYVLYSTDSTIRILKLETVSLSFYLLIVIYIFY